MAAASTTVTPGGRSPAEVPESKTVKNRVHWDVRLNPGVEPRDLQDRGARVLRTARPDEPWAVMADPEGNEFCVFDPE